MSIKDHKKLKIPKTQNLYAHMSETELIFTALDDNQRVKLLRVLMLQVWMKIKRRVSRVVFQRRESKFCSSLLILMWIVWLCFDGCCHEYC